MPATYEPIATTTLGSAANSIIFSSIPQTYTDLRVVFIPVSTSGNLGPLFLYNSDSGANYSYTDLVGNGTSALSNRFNGSSGGSVSIYYGSMFPTTPTLWTQDIFSYSASINKTTLHTLSGDNNGSGVVQRAVSLWLNTSAITSITLKVSGANTMAAGTTATLYGIKAA